MPKSLSKSDPYLYTEGEYLKPADAYVKLTLTKPCPTGGLVLPLGVACASGPSKTATLLSWSAVLSAVAKAVQASPAIRADLRRILGIPIPQEGQDLSAYLDAVNAAAIPDPNVLGLLNARIEGSDIEPPDLIFRDGQWTGEDLQLWRVEGT